MVTFHKNEQFMPFKSHTNTMWLHRALYCLCSTGKEDACVRQAVYFVNDQFFPTSWATLESLHQKPASLVSVGDVRSILILKVNIIYTLRKKASKQYHYTFTSATYRRDLHNYNSCYHSELISVKIIKSWHTRSVMQTAAPTLEKIF